MKVLILHNRYRQQGGEDLVVSSEARLLRSHGVEVFQFEVGNQVSADGTLADAVRLGLAAPWSRDSYEKALKLCEQYRPDVVHVHNFWMRLSPSVHAACRASGAATVQTVHNFRLLCTNALLMRNGRVCEDCLGKIPWRGVVRRCYRGSFLASAAVASMIVSNRRRNTWERDVDAFIALSAHSRGKLIAGSLPADRIFVKPNFVEDPGQLSSPPSSSNLVLYVGRLSKEKGVATLLSAWASGNLGRSGHLLIVGDGPERQTLQAHAVSLGLTAPGVVFAGWKTSGEVLALLEAARVVVIPSIWYEAFPMTVVEAFSRGRPLIVSNLGGLGEIVEWGREGFTYEPGNEAALGRALETVLTEPDLADRMGENARATYLARYTPEQNYQMLMNIYQFAVNRRRGAPRSNTVQAELDLPAVYA